MTQVEALFDKATNTLTYVVWDQKTGDALIIDPVLDYEPGGSVVAQDSVNRIATFVAEKKLRVLQILETHAHADHLSGAQVLKSRYPQAKLAIGYGITKVQKVFKEIFDLASDFPCDGRQFDSLLEEGKNVSVGSLVVQVLSTPGHTPACCSYVIGDAVFTGDALFMPDYGVGRCDFPEGSAEMLFDSVTQKLYSLPGSTRVFTGHDYQPGGRDLRFQSTIDEEKKSNVHINHKTTKEGFVKFRNDRDKALSAPKLLLPSIQVNIDAGHLPASHKNGKRYLSIPIKLKKA